MDRRSGMRVSAKKGGEDLLVGSSAVSIEGKSKSTHKKGDNKKE